MLALKILLNPIHCSKKRALNDIRFLFLIYSITNPFFDPAEIVRKARELNLPVATHNGIKYCQGIKERFGEFYQEIGVLVDSFIGQMAAEK